MAPAPIACTGMVCSGGASLAFELRGARMRVHLDATHVAIESDSTILGGYVFFEDASAGYEARNLAGIKAALTTYATAAGLTASPRDQIHQSFADARDLHMNADGTLSPCRGASAAMVDANAISVALAFDSLP